MPKEVKKATMPLLAMLLAWLVPGAGHFYLGRRARGIVIFLAIGLTFWSGVAMGGVLTVDYYGSRWWFLAEMCTGVHGLYGWHRQNLVYQKVLGSAMPTHTPPDELDAALVQEGVALAHMPTENIARAYAGVAGMLNLLCIVDALMLSIMGIYGETPPPWVKPDKEAAT